MAINKKLIHFSNKTAFDKELKAGNILDKSIVFIKDSQEIYTHGQLYSCKEFDEDTFNYISEQIQKLEPLLEESEYEIEGAVDLGLPSGTLWCDRNIGAENPEDPGLYFQWGDTQGWRADQIGTGEGQKSETWDSYKFSGPGATDSNPQLTKYCNKAEYGKDSFTDNKVILDLKDNAYISRGYTWRMPSEEEFREMMVNTNIERITINGISCLKFINRTDNTKYIIVPSRGVINGDPSSGNLWLSTIIQDDCRLASYAWIYNSGPEFNKPYFSRNRCALKNIRAITTNTNLYNYHTRKEIDELIATIESKIAAIESKVSNIENTSFTNAEYDQTSKELVFYTKNGGETRIDATPFIVDNFVDSVAINGNNLVITFNSESKAPISIPITSIFNPDQYYTKTEVDNKIPTDYVSKSGLDVKSSVIPLSKDNSDTVGVALSHYNHTFTNNQKNTNINVCYTEIVKTSDNSHLLKTNMDVYDGARELESDSNNVVLEKGLKHTIDNININLENKADVDNLPNVISEEVIDSDTFEDFNTVTREELKKDLFINQWDAAWKVSGTVYGKYDPENAPDALHPFMGNDVWMTYEEAIQIMNCAATLSAYQRIAFNFLNVRTLPPIPLGFYVTYVDINYMREMECIRFVQAQLPYIGGIAPANIHFLGDCPKLKRIEGVISLEKFSAQCLNEYFLKGDAALKEVRLKGLKTNISLVYSPLLSLASLQYLIANAANTATITVTVHKDVYAKLTGDTTNAAAAALTEEELAQWQALVTTAAAISISFATV